jgi:hypothetical protein
MKTIENGMLLDAKKVIELDVWSYLERAYSSNNMGEVNGICACLLKNLAECDVSADYEKKEPTWGVGVVRCQGGDVGVVAYKEGKVDIVQVASGSGHSLHRE